MEEIRSFIAIELPETLKEELGRLQAALKRGQPDGIRWVNPASLHLTLKFLGGVAPDKLPDIVEGIKDAAEGIPAFRLGVGGLGGFPNLERIQVAWVGLTGEVEKLQKLAERVETNMDILGFPPEGRGFNPHLTLARAGNLPPDERRAFGLAISRTSFESATTINVESISLMRSQLSRSGAIYTRLESIRLG